MNGISGAGGRISSQAVCGALRHDIISGYFPPGARLAEEAIATRYGVSRVPVREALRTLESEGFVRTRRYAGASVAELTEGEAADLLEIRTLLEPLGVARAAERRTQAHVRVLRGLVRLGQERARRRQLSDLPSLNGWFNETLMRASGSPSLEQPLIQLRHKLAWAYSVELPARAEASWEEHAAITEAVARGEAERARELALTHVKCAAVTYRLRRADRPAGSGDGATAAVGVVASRRGRASAR